MLHGKFLLQADEGLNIGAVVRERYSGNDGNGRCLKLLLTDGGCWVLHVACSLLLSVSSAYDRTCTLVLKILLVP